MLAIRPRTEYSVPGTASLCLSSPSPPMLRHLIAAYLLVLAAAVHAAEPIRIDTPMSPPAWAMLQRELIKANNAACEEFYNRYFDERGWLLCVERWGGDDGPDDAIE